MDRNASLSVQGLLQKFQSRDRISLAAGKTGLRNRVDWIYLAEDIENVPLLKKNELVITTGLFTRTGVSLQSFLEALIAQNQAGLILNVGKYLMESDVTEEICELCEEKQFPLYLMPWEIYLTDVMQHLCGALLEHTQQQHQFSEALQTLLTFPTESESYTDILEQNDFSVHGMYQVLAISGSYSAEPVQQLLQQTAERVHAIVYGEIHLLIFCDAATESVAKLCKQLQSCTELQSSIFGVSSRKQHIRNLRSLYEQAKDAIFAAKMNAEKIAWYDRIGILALIFSVSNPTLLQEFAAQRLHALEAYDAGHAACLVETLFHYLKTGGSLTATAERLFAHRNTVGYRMNKIRELLQDALDDPEKQYEYLTAIYIRKYFQLQQEDASPKDSQKGTR